MASLSDSNLNRESGEETASKLGAIPKARQETMHSADEVSELAFSSSAVLEPSRDESRSIDAAWRRIISRRFVAWSRREAASETIPADEHEAEQQMNGHVEQRSTSCCAAVVNCYSNSVTKFRNSVLMYFLQLLFLSIPSSEIIMGLLYHEDCPKSSFLPGVSAMVGLIGVLFMIFWMVSSCIDRYGVPCSNRRKCMFALCCFIFLIATTVEIVFVALLSPSFDPQSKEYCSETFYTYIFYKEIAIAVVIVLSAMLYLPRSRHILCCHNCSMRSPNAYSSI